MKKHSARVAPLSACNSPVLTLTKVEGEERPRDPPGPAEAPAPAGAEAGGRAGRRCWRCSRARLRKTFWGVAVVLCVCSSWAGATQLAKLTFGKFDAPFTLTWFATNWNFLFFPLYYAGHVCKSAEKQSVKQRYSCLDLNIRQRGRQNQGTVSALWTVSSHWHDHPFKKKPETLISAIYHNVQQGSSGPLRSQMVCVGPGTSSVSILGSHGHPEPRLSVTVYGPAAAGPNQIYPEKNSVKNSGQGDQGMLSIFWRQWLDFEGVCYQGSTLWCSLDTHKLPVLTCNKDNKHHGCLRVVLLQQSFCVLALMDCSQGQVHGREDRGRHPCHRWHRDDDLCGRLPQPLRHRHSPGGGLRIHVCPVQGPVQAPPGQCQVWRSRLISVCAGGI
ncbi:putative thiamine transporter SLC35F3 isoform X2 [Camelus ferus]|uniref:Thiamine transporter SLC35F3 isoform X2 n=1 Tax=Camelus ferus TaxID=419612 RepID=A0A8B8TZF7_CAMFR|nr:putative thiamine transporter SLC35F3 isoform X2 [Camelus ferus]